MTTLIAKYFTGEWIIQCDIVNLNREQVEDKKDSTLERTNERTNQQTNQRTNEIEKEKKNQQRVEKDCQIIAT